MTAPEYRSWYPRFKLAKVREEQHPEDAIAIYRARVETMVERKNNQACDPAAELIGKSKTLMKMSDSSGNSLPGSILFKRSTSGKRNSMRRLDHVQINKQRQTTGNKSTAGDSFRRSSQSR